MNQLVKQKAQDLSAQLSVTEMNISDIDSQIKTLQAQKKNMQSGLDNFKAELREGMKENGITKIESEDKSILFRLDSPQSKVEILNENLIDSKFFKTSLTLDRTAIKKALEVGDLVSGAKLTEGKHRLTIKQ